MVQDLRCWQLWGFIMWSELGHRIVWYVHGYECFGGAFWFCVHRPSDDGSSRFRPYCLCWPFRLHSPITEKTTILCLCEAVRVQFSDRYINVGKTSVLYIFKMFSIRTLLKIVLLIVPINYKNFANLNSTSFEYW